jgi:hypothetical protein
LRISSAVLVHTKGWQRSFQPSTKARILALRSLTEPKGSAVDGLAFDDAEPDLDEVEPGPRGRGEVGVDSGVVGGEPVANFDTLVGGVVVHHQVQLAAVAGVGVGPGYLLEERQELLVTVARLARPGDLAGLERRCSGRVQASR